MWQCSGFTSFVVSEEKQLYLVQCQRVHQTTVSQSAPKPATEGQKVLNATRLPQSIRLNVEAGGCLVILESDNVPFFLHVYAEEWDFRAITAVNRSLRCPPKIALRGAQLLRIKTLEAFRKPAFPVGEMKSQVWEWKESNNLTPCNEAISNK